MWIMAGAGDLREDWATIWAAFAPRSRLLASILRHLKGRPVLTGQRRGRFVRRGGTIAFEGQDETLRFTANNRSANNGGISLGSLECGWHEKWSPDALDGIELGFRDWPVKTKVSAVIYAGSLVVWLTATSALFTAQMRVTRSAFQHDVEALAAIIAGNCAAPLAFNGETVDQQTLASLRGEVRNRLRGRCHFGGQVLAVFGATEHPVSGQERAMNIGAFECSGVVVDRQFSPASPVRVTTRQEGHGFGLHSGALAARSMGGTLPVASAGIGQGATFTLELPIASNKPNV